MSVIDRAWADPDQKFVRIHLDLVAEVGCWEKAAIISRLAFRTDARSVDAVEVDGILWWRARLEDLAAELGIKLARTQRLFAELVKDGTIIREKHRTDGPYDQTYSYRINYGTPPTAPESPKLQIPNIEDADPQDVDVADLQHLPLVNEVNETPQPPTGGPGDDHRMFDQVWDAYPKHEDRQAALIEWYRVVRSGRASQLDLIIAAKAYAEHVRTSGTEPRFVKSLANWLKAGSYENTLPTPSAALSVADRWRAYNREQRENENRA